MSKMCPYCDQPLFGELAQTSKGLIHRKCLYLSRGGDRAIVETLFRDEDTKPLFPQHPAPPDPEPDIDHDPESECDHECYDHHCSKCGIQLVPYDDSELPDYDSDY